MRVIIESPYAGDVQKNMVYLQFCMRDCLLRGEAPFASHGLYTQPNVLDDNIPQERKLGMEMGQLWYSVADKVVVYKDLGISEGMKAGIRAAAKHGIPTETRYLYAANQRLNTIKNNLR